MRETAFAVVEVVAVVAVVVFERITVRERAEVLIIFQATGKN